MADPRRADELDVRNRLTGSSMATPAQLGAREKAQSLAGEVLTELKAVLGADTQNPSVQSLLSGKTTLYFADPPQNVDLDALSARLSTVAEVTLCLNPRSHNGTGLLCTVHGPIRASRTQRAALVLVVCGILLAFNSFR